LGDVGANVRMIKVGLEEKKCGVLDSYVSGYGTVAGSCEYDNDSCSIRQGEFLNYLSSFLFLKWDFVLFQVIDAPLVKHLIQSVYSTPKMS
jgi:hypothetical protein